MANNLKAVEIIVSNLATGEVYLSRSYPDDDYDNNGKIELYNVPVHKVFIRGINNTGMPEKKEWKAVRFMPYWNDPAAPVKTYKSRGWINAGKHKVARKVVSYYNPDYGTHNRYSPYGGAIQIEDSFLIHAGPNSLAEYGWGSAGCVEIIGNFDDFKKDIQSLSGSSKINVHAAILELVAQKKLFVQVDYAAPIDIKKQFVRQE